MKKLISTFFAATVAVSAFAITPAEAEVKATIEGLEKAAEQGTLLTALCDALPEKQQNAFFNLSHAFATKMDPVVWDAHTIVLDSIGKVCSTKSNFIVNNESVRNLIPRLCTSEMATADEIVEFGNFLQNIASITSEDIKAQPNAKALAVFLDSKIGKFPDSKKKLSYIVTTDDDGDVVVCFCHNAIGDCDNCIEFEKVAGKWIPEELEDVDDINEEIAEINSINFNSEEGAKIKMNAIMYSTFIKALSAPVLQAKTQEEFDAAINSLDNAWKKF